MPVSRIHQANASQLRATCLPRVPTVIVTTALLLFLHAASIPIRAQSNPSPKGGSRAQDFVPTEMGPRVDHQTRIRWSPWNEAAFDRARAEKKPVLFFIEDQNEYLCNAMQRNVLSQSEVVDELNSKFICIYANCAESPELTRTYQASLGAYYQLARAVPRDEWPSILFLTPEQQPYAAGTYFPLTSNGNLPGFPQVIRDAAQAWSSREKDARATATLVMTEARKRLQPAIIGKGLRLDAGILATAATTVSDSMLPEVGGWPLIPGQTSPLIHPFPVRLQFLQSRIGRDESASPQLAKLVNLTLDEISAGGIHDQLAGGFHHAGRDGDWLIPKFQKSLVENSLLAEVFVDAYRRTGRENYRQTAERIFEFVQRELTANDGGFFTGVAADVNGIDGQYQSWTRDELESVLSPVDYRLFSAVYGVNKPHTFPTGHILARQAHLNDAARQLAVPMKELDVRLEGVRGKLLEIRRKRPAPRKDDHILTSSNGLMIRAFASGGRILKRRDFVDSAERAALRLLSHHRDTNGRLLHCVIDPQTTLPAALEDYACFVSGLLALHETTGEDKWLNSARRLTDDQISLFWDSQHFGFFETAQGQPFALIRIKTAEDQLWPAGNATSVQNLVRLSRLKADESYRTHASRILTVFSGTLHTHPEKCCGLALALQDYLHWFGSLDSLGQGPEGLFVGGISSPRDIPEKKDSAVPQKKNPTPGSLSPPASFPTDPLPGTKVENPVLTQKLTTGGDASALANEVQQEHRETRGVFVVQPDTLKLPVQVTAAGVLGADAGVAGRHIPFAVQLQVPVGWAAIGDAVLRDGLTPLQMTVVSPQGAKIHELQYSRPQALLQTTDPSSIDVFRGQVDVIGSISLPPDSAGELLISLRLDYQLCQEHRALPPQEIALSTRFTARADSRMQVELHRTTIDAAKLRLHQEYQWTRSTPRSP